MDQSLASAEPSQSQQVCIAESVTNIGRLVEMAAALRIQCQEPVSGYCNVVTTTVLTERLHYLSMQQVGQFRNMLNFSEVMDDL